MGTMVISLKHIARLLVSWVALNRPMSEDWLVWRDTAIIFRVADRGWMITLAPDFRRSPRDIEHKRQGSAMVRNRGDQCLREGQLRRCLGSLGSVFLLVKNAKDNASCDQERRNTLCDDIRLCWVLSKFKGAHKLESRLGKRVARLGVLAKLKPHRKAAQ